MSTLNNRKTETPARNAALLNVVAPSGLTFKSNSVIVGENIVKFYAVTWYPQSVNYGWAAELCNIPDTIATVAYTPIEAGRFIEALNTNIKMARGDALDAKSPLAQQRAEKTAEDGERIMSEIDQSGEAVGKVSITIAVVGKNNGNDELFAKQCKRAESAIKRVLCKSRVLSCLQEDAYRHISPSFAPQERVLRFSNRIMPLVTLFGGSPFAASGFNDGTGMVLGRDALGGLVTVDFAKRDTDRTNSNIVILGTSGMGKSATIKNIAMQLWERGWRIIFIDYEREYKDLTKGLGGDWINVAGGSQGMLNPLQVRPFPHDDDNTEQGGDGDVRDDSLPDLALHIQTLLAFFNLYIPNMSNMQSAYLQDSLTTFYAGHGIKWDTDIAALKPGDFPIFSDFYEFLRLKLEHVPASIKPQAEEVMFLIKPLADGADSFIWNGVTTVNAKSDCICLDTHDLENMDAKIKRAQYFNLLAWCWEQISRDREKPVMLIADEAHMMIDPNVPQSLSFLKSVSKRARKYNSALAVATQDIQDFLDPAVKRSGLPILANAAYKILMGMDGENLKQVSDLYGLTDAEHDFLDSRQRRTALMGIGAKRLKVRFEISDWRIAEYFGTGGGR